MKPTRRNFLKTAASAALAANAVSSPAFLRCVRGDDAPNSRLRLGSIGVGGRGEYDTGLHKPFSELVAVCDLDSRRSGSANERLTGGKAQLYADYRRILDRSNVDVVTIGTPDHWHTKICLDALAAGKHIFCEKPLTLTIRENQVLREAAEKHPECTFIVGTQRRAELPRFTRAVNMVRRGLLGEIKNVQVSISKSFNATFAPPKDQRFPLAEVPAEFDWNTWLGQTPVVAYREKRSHVYYRYWYEYSGGRITDWGAHYLDSTLWALGQDQKGQGLVHVDASDCNHPLPMKDGYPLEDDYYSTAHDFCLKGRLANGIPVQLETRLNDAILFEGTKGRIRVNCGSISGTPIEENWDADCYSEAEQRELFKGKPVESHMANFYRCIREGGLPISDVFSHTQVMTACHVFAIAARLGRSDLTFDPVREVFVNDDAANSFLTREQRKGFEVC